MEPDMPSVACESPVPDVDDLPVGQRCEVDNNVDARVVCAVGNATAEDHLTSSPVSTGLTGRESERAKNRIEDLGDQLDTRSRVTGWMWGP